MNDKSIDADHDGAGPLADAAPETRTAWSGEPGTTDDQAFARLADESLALDPAERTTEADPAIEGPATTTGGAPVVARSTNPDTIEHEET